jgi:hypothetical protein
VVVVVRVVEVVEVPQRESEEDFAFPTLDFGGNRRVATVNDALAARAAHAVSLLLPQRDHLVLQRIWQVAQASGSGEAQPLRSNQLLEGVGEVVCCGSGRLRRRRAK